MELCSPEPWTYDEWTRSVRDAQSRTVAETYGPYRDANGHRIAALSAENARLREAVRAFLDDLDEGRPMNSAGLRAALAPEAGR